MKFTKWKGNIVCTLVAVGVYLLFLAAYRYHEGMNYSHDAQLRVEELGKIAGGDAVAVPTSGTDYALEARIVGQETWARGYINVDFGDQVEVRFRIATMTGLDQSDVLRDGVVTFKSERLVWVRESDAYVSPDDEYIAYLPIGVYEIDYGHWPYDRSACTLGVFHDGSLDEVVLGKLVIVPLTSELNSREVLVASVLGIISLFAAGICGICLPKED